MNLFATIFKEFAVDKLSHILTGVVSLVVLSTVTVVGIVIMASLLISALLVVEFCQELLICWNKSTPEHGWRGGSHGSHDCFCDLHTKFCIYQLESLLDHVPGLIFV
jgi:hypothetical protein